MTESERPESDALPPSETDFAADNRYGNDPIPVSPRLPKPQPGLLWSVVAAVVFLAITIVALIGGTLLFLLATYAHGAIGAGPWRWLA